MLITVAVCTFNRAASLRRTLESLAAMNVPGDLVWEVVVVNNNCTDRTDEIIETFGQRLPLRRMVEELRHDGKLHVRGAGGADDGRDDEENKREEFHARSCADPARLWQARDTCACRRPAT